jgi:hypothetical protein
MTGILIEFLLGLYFIGIGFDKVPNWWKVGFGAGLLLLALLKVNLV